MNNQMRQRYRELRRDAGFEAAHARDLEPRKRELREDFAIAMRNTGARCACCGAGGHSRFECPFWKG
jgi:hypothetical protein